MSDHPLESVDVARAREDTKQIVAIAVAVLVVLTSLISSCKEAYIASNRGCNESATEIPGFATTVTCDGGAVLSHEELPDGKMVAVCHCSAAVGEESLP